jgi:citrate lyase subunit beta/citryl-CoA lyase
MNEIAQAAVGIFEGRFMGVHCAGRFGPGIRSDCRASIELRSHGGLEIELRSRVAAYYGESLRAQAVEVLQVLGVGHARLLLEDAGALPYVVAARIEAAVCRAGFTPRKRALPERGEFPPESARDRLRRSRLYLPGNEPKYFTHAALYQPDAVIFDLEDSVHPAEKDAARVLVRNALVAVDLRTATGKPADGTEPVPCERMVRINQLPAGLTDLDEIIPQFPDVILIPKVEHAAQVAEADARVTSLLASVGSKRSVWLIPIIESALGIENAFAIAGSSPRICALSIGLEDYTADLGVARTASGRESLYARMRVVNAAKAAGIQATDSVFSDIGDEQGLARWAEESRALGFEGMGCIHPLQIEPIHRAFTPSRQEIEKALRIVSAFEAAQSQGLNVVALGAKMIDPPVVTRAVKLVERAQQMGLVTPEMRAQAEAAGAEPPHRPNGAGE